MTEASEVETTQVVKMVPAVVGQEEVGRGAALRQVQGEVV